MKPIVATIHQYAHGPISIFPGASTHYERTGEDRTHDCDIHLTEDHIFELVTINKAWYQTQLLEGIKAGLISPNP